MHWDPSGDCAAPHQVEQVGFLGEDPQDWTAPPVWGPRLEVGKSHGWHWVPADPFAIPFPGDEQKLEFWSVERKLRERKFSSNVIPQDRQFFLTIMVRCRKCEPCKAWRRRLWAARALTEMQLSSRTWFCTYTLRPRALLRARVEARSNDYDAIARVMLKWFTKYLKRLRKEVKVPLRYFVVAEPHRGGGEHDGMPHLHALIHERGCEIGNRAIKGKWQRHGFADCKLADAMHAHYLSKYVGKLIASRARASQRYGAVPEGVDFRSSIGSVVGDNMPVTNSPSSTNLDLWLHDVELDEVFINQVEGD